MAIFFWSLEREWNIKIVVKKKDETNTKTRIPEWFFIVAWMCVSVDSTEIWDVQCSYSVQRCV